MLKKVHAASAFGLIALFAASAAVQAQTSLNVSTYAPYQHPLVSVGLVNWGKDVEQETKGRVRINILQTSLGQPAAQYDLAVNAVADISLGIPGLTPGRFYVVEVAGVPNTGNSGEGLSVALWRTYEKHPEMQKEFSQVQVLGLFTTSPAHFFNSKRPINTFDDFKGLKSRVAGGMMSEIAKTLGITPVLAPAGKAYELLSGGVIDAVIFPQETMKSFKLEKLVKYGTIIPGGLTAVPIILAMNRGKFEGLPKEDQAALMRASGERLSRTTGRVWDERDRDGIESLKKEGGIVSVANPELTKSIFAASQAAVDLWVKDVKEKSNADGLAVLATFRAEVKKAETK